MRPFAWLLVVVGILIAAGSIFLVGEANRTSEQAAWNIARRGGGYRRPEPTPLWPGLVVGLGCTALGIIVLAIRPPNRTGRRIDDDDDYDDDEPPTISFRKGRPR